MSVFDSQFMNDMMLPMATRLDVMRSDAQTVGAVHHRGET